MAQFLVTVKLARGLDHRPLNKKTGMCPANPGKLCTDVTGEHHTILWEGNSLQDATDHWIDTGMHVTRVEEV